jgi:hypothetical protein
MRELYKVIRESASNSGEYCIQNIVIGCRPEHNYRLFSCLFSTIIKTEIIVISQSETSKFFAKLSFNIALRIYSVTYVSLSCNRISSEA